MVVDLLETSDEKAKENVRLMGYEMLIWWMLMVWIVLPQRLQSVMRWSVSEIEAILRGLAGQDEGLPSIPISIAAPLQWLMSENRRPGKGRQRNLHGIVSYPDDLLRCQVRRLAVF